jgi:hypothetical protein
MRTHRRAEGAGQSLLLTTLLVLALPACDPEPGSSSPTSVCPTCEAGGDTTDFPAPSLDACVRALRSRELSAEEAEALTFVEEGLLERIQQPIDMPMRWKPQDAEHVRVLGTYEKETRVHVTTRILSYTYWDLDPALCGDDKTCTVDGEEIDGSPCRPVLGITVENRLRTEDNALNATLTGQVGIWGSHPDEVHVPNAVRCHSIVDLRDVLGTLRFELDEPRPARLLLQINYDGPETDGYVAPQVILSDIGAGAYDTPLRGGWGSFYDW